MFGEMGEQQEQKGNNKTKTVEGFGAGGVMVVS